MQQGVKALELAETAIASIGVDPSAASRIAAEALVAARACPTGDPLAVSTAQRAVGLAARAMGDLDGAAGHLRAAAETAEAAELEHAAGQARLSLSGAFILRGDYTAARHELNGAGALLAGDELLQVTCQLGVLSCIEGRWDDALANFHAAAVAYAHSGAELDEAWALSNRGMAHLHTGRLGAAEADLTRAAELYQRGRQEWNVADVVLNLGCVATRQGNIPLALAQFDRAERLFRAGGHVPPQALLDRCEALLAARLLPEARRSAERAVRELTRGGAGFALAYARLFLSEAALLQGDVTTAGAEATLAKRALSRGGSESWAAVARLAAARAAHAGGQSSARLLSSARQAATELEAAGFPHSALDARLLGAQVALALGRPAEARLELDGARRQRIGTVGARTRAWHAEALLRLTDGDRRGATTALRAGMAMVERHRATLGATELRAQASGWGGDLAALGLAMAVEDADADAVLTWSERFRANALATASLRPPADEELGRLLAELRAVAASTEEAAREGHPAGPLLRRQRRLEEAVRNRARQARGAIVDESAPSLSPRALLEALGERILVEFVEDGGQLFAVVVHRASRPSRRLVALGPVAALDFELEAALFALRRLVAGRRTEAGRLAARRALDHANGRLDDQLLAPLHLEPAAPLVLVPTGALHRLAWSLLASCAGRSIEVAPSASLWAEAASAGPRSGRAGAGGVVLVAGPGLPGAGEEVRSLGEEYPAARSLTGADATVGAVAAALDGASTAHIAAHGSFRSDNPLMSCLRLADGPLTVYDLERLRHPPDRLVLSACDAGVSDVRAGDELMGLAAAVLGLGTRSVVAAVLPVSDDTTRAFMVGFHALLRKGLGPADALRRAQADAADPDGAAAFLCLGAG